MFAVGCRSEDTATAGNPCNNTSTLYMKNTDVLNLSKEFCGACNMFNTHPLTALQFYISQTTVFSNLAKIEEVTFYLSTKIFDLSRHGNNQRKKMEDYKRLTSIKYIKEVMKIIMNNKSAEMKDRAYKNLINEWYKAIEATLPPKTIKTSNGFTIFLTKDFSILCDIFQTTPERVLQYYINHVSITEHINSTKKNPYTYATSFFLQYPPIIKQINAS
jgi:hypothetical protein